MNIGIYIYDNAEVLDFSGPFEVFTTASRVCEDEEAFNVFLIGETGGMVTARAGYQVNPNHGFHDHPSIDLLFVVGGFHFSADSLIAALNHYLNTPGSRVTTRFEARAAAAKAQAAKEAQARKIQARQKALQSVTSMFIREYRLKRLGYTL